MSEEKTPAVSALRQRMNRGYRRLDSDRRGRELARRNGRAFPATLWPKPSRVSPKLRAE